MKSYKVHIFCPDDTKLVERIVKAAGAVGAGKVGNYSEVAFVSPGVGQWKSEKGAHPTIGKVGTLTKQKEVHIEMLCPSSKAKAVKNAVRKVHPYEEPVIEFVLLSDP